MSAEPIRVALEEVPDFTVARHCGTDSECVRHKEETFTRGNVFCGHGTYHAFVPKGHRELEVREHTAIAHQSVAVAQISGIRLHPLGFLSVHRRILLSVWFQCTASAFDFRSGFHVSYKGVICCF